MNIYALIIVIVVAVIGASFLGFSVTDFFNDIKKTVADEKENERRNQGVTDDPDVETQGSNKEKTGGTECDLQLNFVGSISGKNNLDNLMGDNGINIWHGKFGDDRQISPLTSTKHDDSVINYTWFNCSDNIDPKTGLKQNSILNAFETFSITSAHNLKTMQLNAVTNLNETIDLWFEFKGKSLNGYGDFVGKVRDGAEPQLQFSGYQTFTEGMKLPAEYDVSIIVRDVPLDDYSIKFWNPDFKANDEIAGHKFSSKICLPTDPYKPC